MAEPLTKAVEIFYCFASEDRALQNELGKHLSNFKRQYIITEWYHAMIGPGEERTRPINLHLNTAQLFLLLVSPDFMASDQCYFKMMRAVESCDAKENPLVFPIHLRPVDYQDAPFSEFQILPDGCEPFTTSPNRDEAYQKIVEVIWESVEAILLLQWTQEAYAYEKAERYEDALFAYEQTFLLRPQEWSLYSARGFVLRALGH